MHGNGIGKLQLFHCVKSILHPAPLVKLYLYVLCVLVDLPDHAHISVEHAHAFVHSKAKLRRNLPLHLVIVLDLHDLIPFPEQTAVDLLLRFLRILGIQVTLKDRVQPFDSQEPLPRRSHDLDLTGLGAHIPGQLLLDEHNSHPDDRIRILAPQEEEVPAFIVEDYRLPGIDLMRVHHNIALPCLAEDPGQGHHREALRGDNVFQHTSRPHRGKLVHIPDQHQPRPRHDCREQGVHQRQIHHGHLVNDDHVRFQGILTVPHKSAHTVRLLRIYIYFQEPVDSLRLIARGFGHALRRASGGSSQQDAHALAVKKADHRIDGGRFSGTGASGQDEEPVLDGFDHRLMLHRVQLDLLGLFHLPQSPLHHIFRHFAVNIQVMEHFRRIQLQIVIVSRIDPDPVLAFFHHSLFLNAQVHHMFADILYLHAEQLACPADEHFLREIDVPLSHSLLQRIEKPALDPVIRIRMYPDARGDLVSCLKSHTLYIICQLVRVLFQNFVYTHTVILVYLRGKSGGDPIFLEIDHRLAHVLLLFHLLCDLSCLALADPFDFRQALRLLFDDPEGVLFKFLYDPSCQGSPHAFDRT